MSDTADLRLTSREEEFVEAFSEEWSRTGAPRIQGRLLAYLLVTRRAEVTSADICADLGASTGAVSTAARALVQRGFIRRFQKPGERAFYFRAHDDVWGGFLATERQWVVRTAALIRDVMDDVRAEEPRSVRLHDALDYMEWFADHNLRMVDDWNAYLVNRRAQ